MFQQIIIVGRVGRDADSKFLQSGSQVTNFSVATTEYWRDSSTNERQERTTWHKVAAWGGLGEVCAKYVKKGMLVQVVGTASASAYMGQDGQPQASLDIKAREVNFLSRADDTGKPDDVTDMPQSDNLPF